MVENSHAPLATEPGLLAVGQKVGNYRVVGLLGRGGMGAVYEAVHVYIERQAAVKVLHPDLSQDARFANRFLNEARAVNLVKHPGLVEIFEFGLLDSGAAYIIMEYLDGETLSHHIQHTPEQLQGEALFICRQIAQAMAAAHDKGIVHRDLKPDNVMLVPDPERPGLRRIKVLDFGIAKVAQHTGAELHTQTGTTIGTPAYMSPEQCKSTTTLDGKSDVYALGVMLYEMLAGCLPFMAQHSFDYMAAHVRLEPRPLREAVPEVPEPVATLVHQMLAKDPEARPSMADVVSRLDRMREAAPDLWVSAGRLSPYSPARMNSAALAATMQADSTPVGLPAKVPAAPKRRTWPALLLGGVLLVSVVSYAAVRFLRPAAGVALPARQPAAPRMVKWIVHSKPDGAEVIRDDGKVLGVTPLQLEVPAGPETTRVILRHAEYQDKSLLLRHDIDSGWELELARVPPMAPPAQTASPAASTAPGASTAPAAAASSKSRKARGRPSGDHTGKSDVKLLMD
jgi:serine/threonine-protein kinase